MKPKIICGLIIVFTFAHFSGKLWAKTHGYQDSGSPQNQLKYFDRIDLTVEDFPAEGFILDIGGGGEGIIGQLKGSQVIAIDISKRELEEAPPGPLKIVMDARELKFLDGTFMTTTVFFTFMYIDDDDHRQVFREIHRTLKQGGRLLIWDVILPGNTESEKTMAVFPLSIELPEKEVKTGYGVRWPKAGRDLSHYLDLAQESGFDVVKRQVEGPWFFLEMTKK